MAKPEIHERHDVFKGAPADESRIAAAADPIIHPEGAFERPISIADDRDLSLDEKLQALNNWDKSVRRRLAAESQGSDGGTSDHDLDLLEGIEEARAALRQGDRWWLGGNGQVPSDGHSHHREVLTPTEARQGSGRRMNFRILERSLFLAVLAAAALYLWFYFS